MILVTNHLTQKLFVFPDTSVPPTQETIKKGSARRRSARLMNLEQQNKSTEQTQIVKPTDKRRDEEYRFGLLLSGTSNKR